MDDVVVKTRNSDDFIKDLEETFDNLRKFRSKLNPQTVFSAYHQENYSVSSSVTEALRLTLKR